VADAREARERLREDVMQPVARAVDRVARQQRAERERVAVRVVRIGGERLRDQPRRLTARQGRNRARVDRRRALGRVRERRERARGEIGRTPGSDVSAPCARRCTRVISAALSVVGIAATRGRRPGARAAASAFAVSMTRPPPSATIRVAGPTKPTSADESSSTRPGPISCIASA
jgi:hypothetical protein